MKRIGRPPADRTGSDFSSDATLANAKDGNHNSNSARDVSRKGSSFDKPTIVDAHKGNNQHRSERNEEYSGQSHKLSMNYRIHSLTSHTFPCISKNFKPISLVPIVYF